MLHIKMIMRSWWRNKLNTTISFISLTVGLVCSIMLIMFVLYEHKVANALGDTANVYLIERDNPFYSERNVRTVVVDHTLGEQLKERYGEIEDYCMVGMFDRWTAKDGEKSVQFEVNRVSPSLCDMFDISVKEGDLRRTLNTANEIAVTQSFMRKNFGRDAMLGDKIEATSGGHRLDEEGQIPAENHSMTITTILDEQTKTPFRYGALAHMSADDSKRRDFSAALSMAFIRLRADVKPETIIDKYKADSTYFKDATKDPIYLTSFGDVYFDGTNMGAAWQGDFLVRRDGKLLTIGLSIAFAILIIAAFNYINITMTRARSRLKNVAGQRIFGATKQNLRWQTILDTALITLFSFCVSLLFINALLPQFNEFMECQVEISNIFQGLNWVYISAVLALLILLPSLYVLAKIEMTDLIGAFKKSRSRRNTISNIMVIAQISISVVLIVVSINISRQMNFIATTHVNAESIILFSNYQKPGITPEFINEVRSQAMVEDITFWAPIPLVSIAINGVAMKEMKSNEKTADFYNLTFIEGRNFVEGENENNIIVNQTMLQKFEIEQPATGKTFDWNGEKKTIIGVVKDFIYESAHNAIQSLMIQYDKGDINDGVPDIFIRIKGDKDIFIDRMTALWKEKYSDKNALDVKQFSQIYRDMHPQEQRLMTMVDIFMVISMLLTALGLFGLAFYTVGQRTKEIALRKIHGSTTVKVIVRLCRVFIIWTAVAFVLAVPAAYYFSNDWLSGFTYRVDMVVWVFLATAAVVTAVTFFTVIFQTWRAASANPANSIKSE